jgi:hypothetical protein
VPRQKNFKRLVRSRMARTGESYTTARSRFVAPTAGAPDVTADPDAAALARALAAAGVANPVTGQPFTAELLFGAAGGIGFMYLVFEYPGWTSVNVDGRHNALYFDKKGLIETACARLGVPVRVRPTADRDTTERHLRAALASTPEVALTVELARVPGATPGTVPMLPHPVTVADDGPELTVLGLPRGRVTMSWDELLDARWTHARKYGGLYQFQPRDEAVDVRAAVLQAAGRTADCLLEPGRGTNFDGSFGVPGIRRWARLLTDAKDKKGWPKLFGEPDALSEALAAVVRGLGGPGPSGSASRHRYAAFLDEAAALADRPDLAAVADTYRALADRWAGLIRMAGQPGTTGADLAEPLPELADAEEQAALALRAAATGPADGGRV